MVRDLGHGGGLGAGKDRGSHAVHGDSPAGESRRFTGLEFATLRVGNAGGLTLRVNGRAVPRIGPPGTIRVINLTPETIDIVIPPRKPVRLEE